VPHPELSVEQEHLDRARTAISAMAARTEGAVSSAESAATESDSEVARWHLRRRLESLADPDGVPAFGRIDGAGDRWYVGRRHVEDDAGEPLVVDWRAPVSVPFYRATVHDPLGLDRRRRFTADGRVLVDILEEDFTDPDGSAVAGGIPDPLLAELDRERTGTMRDIVATIAAEQDEVIRTPLDRLLVVQGGPGTGKTAVALHRAAFLLFEHRMELMGTGLLVIGPNPVFLRYVADVLPSLGETAVRQTTVEGLRPASVRLGDDDPTEVGQLKGDGRMAQVIDRLVRGTIRLPTDSVAINTARGTVRLDPAAVELAVADILARNVPHATGKESLRHQLLHVAYATHERTAEVPALKAEFVAAARSDDGFRRYLDRVWPTLSAPAVVQKLLGSATTRRSATGDLLDDAEAALLGRATARRIADERWSPADVALVDEAEARINGTRVTYGHIVVDEAQDLSTMALRMLGRRARNGSMTVVGDLAQGTRAWASRSWDDVVSVLRGSAPVHRTELTVGYRTPAPVLDLANRLLPLAAADVTPARSIRRSGEPPAIEHAEDPVAAAAGHAAAATGQRGTVAVIAVAADHAALGSALAGAGVHRGSGADGLGGVALLTPLLAKGLEFDTVVVVEPAAIVEAEPAGHRALFVALTRPTRRLVVVHHRPLPDPLAGG
jgi:DNA helicase IV